LAQLAKTTGIAGWHQMRKEELIQAIVKLLKKRGQFGMGPEASRVSRTLENPVPRNVPSRPAQKSSQAPKNSGKSGLASQTTSNKSAAPKNVKNASTKSATVKPATKKPSSSGEKAALQSRGTAKSDRREPPALTQRPNKAKTNTLSGKVPARSAQTANPGQQQNHRLTAADKKISTAASTNKAKQPSTSPRNGHHHLPGPLNGHNGAHGTHGKGAQSNGVHSNGAQSNGAYSNGKSGGKASVSSQNGGATRKSSGLTHDSAQIANQPVHQPSAIAAQLQLENDRREELKNLALSALVAKENRKVEKDRLILIVRDSHWLQTYWEITEATIRRARAALEKNWRGARPVLRLLEIVDEGDGPNEVVRREIEIHSGVDTWYIDSGKPAHTYRVMIGYATGQGRFFPLAKSNKVTTPSPGSPAPQDHWADIANHYESYFAMSGGFSDDNESRDLQDVFEEKLRRPVKTLSSEQSRMIDHRGDFRFEVDAQMVIFGIANPDAVVSVGGEPLRIEENGTFSIRVDMPDKRQVFPVVACSRDGSHQRTTVLAVERNTKVMDPVHMEADDS
jgi:hypothetical protein